MTAKIDSDVVKFAYKMFKEKTIHLNDKDKELS